jgi:hypothetical protein
MPGPDLAAAGGPSPVPDFVAGGRANPPSLARSPGYGERATGGRTRSGRDASGTTARDRVAVKSRRVGRYAP